MIPVIYTIFGLIGIAGVVDSQLRSRHVRLILALVFAITLMWLAGFRTIGIDQDSIGYYNYYNLDEDHMALAAEPTFVLISRFAHWASPLGGLTIVFVIYSLLGVSVKFFAISKLSNQFWLCVLTYFSQYFLLHEMTQIRAGCASAFILMAVYYTYRRNLFRYIIAITAAVFFHFSAIVCIPLYVLSNKVSNFKRIMIGIAIPLALLFRQVKLNISFVAPVDLIDNKINVYATSITYNSIDLNPFNLVYLVKYALLYLLLFREKQISKSVPNFMLMLQIYALSMFAYLALSYNVAFAVRISELLGIVEIVLIPTLVYAFRDRPVGIAAVLSLAVGNLMLGLYQTELIQTI